MMLIEDVVILYFIYLNSGRVTAVSTTVVGNSAYTKGGISIAW